MDVSVDFDFGELVVRDLFEVSSLNRGQHESFKYENPDKKMWIEVGVIKEMCEFSGMIVRPTYFFKDEDGDEDDAIFVRVDNHPDMRTYCFTIDMFIPAFSKRKLYETKSGLIIRYNDKDRSMYAGDKLLCKADDYTAFRNHRNINGLSIVRTVK